MVLESLLWPFLSSLVFISVTSFLSLHASAITTATVASCRWTSDVIQSSSLGSEPAAAVVKKFHTAQTTTLCIIATNIAPLSFLKVLLRSSSADLHIRGYLATIGDRTRRSKILRRLHAPPRDATPALVASTSTDLLTSSSVVDRWPLTSRWPLTGCWPLANRWSLTFRLTFSWPGSPYPVFRLDFISAVGFCILCL